jgi:hypothetical protein
VNIEPGAARPTVERKSKSCTQAVAIISNSIWIMLNGTSEEFVDLVSYIFGVRVRRVAFASRFGCGRTISRLGVQSKMKRDTREEVPRCDSLVTRRSLRADGKGSRGPNGTRRLSCVNSRAREQVRTRQIRSFLTHTVVYLRSLEPKKSNDSVALRPDYRRRDFERNILRRRKTIF